MTKTHYRLEIGSKCVCLDDVNRAITLNSSKYTPMDFKMAKKVINEIGADVIKVYMLETSHTERETQLDIRLFNR